MDFANSPQIAARALEFVREGDVIGLGSGHAATAFVHALAGPVRAGFRVRAVPTSEATAALARRLGIPLITLEDTLPIDLAVDGADEVDPDLNLIKGWGGALVREKIVAAAARRLIILIGPEKTSEKLVEALGSRGRLPIEVVPFGLALCRERLAALGCPPTPRTENGALFVTDNGNYILDCKVSALRDPAALEQAILAVPGVIDTGLFLGMADTVLIQQDDTVEVRRRRTT